MPLLLTIVISSVILHLLLGIVRNEHVNEVNSFNNPRETTLSSSLFYTDEEKNTEHMSSNELRFGICRSGTRVYL